MSRYKVIVRAATLAGYLTIISLPKSEVRQFWDYVLYKSEFGLTSAVGRNTNISKLMLAFWATPSLVQHGTVGPAEYGANMRAVCHKDVSE